MVEPLISHGLFYRSPHYVSEPWSCKDPCCLWEGPRALRFHQNYLHLCSEDERRSHGFGTTWGMSENDRIFIFGWTMPFFWTVVYVIYVLFKMINLHMTGLFQVHIGLCISVSQQTEVIRKLATCFISLLVFLSVCKFCPVERNVDDDFIATTPFYAQVVYLYLSMLTTRPKYYFVWTLGAWTSCLSFSSLLARFLSPLSLVLIFIERCLFVSSCLCLCSVDGYHVLISLFIRRGIIHLFFWGGIRHDPSEKEKDLTSLINVCVYICIKPQASQVFLQIDQVLFPSKKISDPSF